MLIALVIVGIVAALTVPIFVSKINDKIYESGRKKALAIFGEASKNLAAQDELTGARDAEDFVKNRLSKQIAIIKMCNYNNLIDCKLPQKIKFRSSEINMPKGVASSYTGFPGYGYGFMMKNGYSVILFSQPNCKDAISTYSTDTLSGTVQYPACFGVLYDINGLKGPNEIGKDIGFVTSLYPDTRNISYAPMPTVSSSTKMNYNEAQTFCSNNDSVVPTLDQALALQPYRDLTINGSYVWTSTSSPRGNSSNWIIRFGYGVGNLLSWSKTSKYGGVICIKRTNWQ